MEPKTKTEMLGELHGLLLRQQDVESRKAANVAAYNDELKEIRDLIKDKLVEIKAIDTPPSA